jgi:hypothetical protein
VPLQPQKQNDLLVLHSLLVGLEKTLRFLVQENLLLQTAELRMGRQLQKKLLLHFLVLRLLQILKKIPHLQAHLRALLHRLPIDRMLHEFLLRQHQLLPLQHLRLQLHLHRRLLLPLLLLQLQFKMIAIGGKEICRVGLEEKKLLRQPQLRPEKQKKMKRSQILHKIL